MKVYLVGGAVRDKLLGRAVHDADYVVVGSTIEEMLEQGFSQVGADFPVFLHPTTKQEYALARTERKSGQGYAGFEVHASPDVTLEDDLIRRDLTVNAMAIEVNSLYDSSEKTGEIIDPHGGMADLENRVLRHVSPSFSEDPLRVLRVARFYSRYYQLSSSQTEMIAKEKETTKSGFSIAPETLELMKRMVANGDLNHLSRERIWTESQRASMSRFPHIYWQTLYELGALALFTPLDNYWHQHPYRQQIILSALALSEQFNLSMEQRWSILTASFDDTIADTPQDLNSPDKDASTQINQQWQTALQQLTGTNKIPKKISQFAKLYASIATDLKNISSHSPAEMMALLQASNGHKQPEQFAKLLLVQHLLQFAQEKQLMSLALQSYQAVGMKDIDSSLTGKAIGEALSTARIDDLAQRLSSLNKTLITTESAKTKNDDREQDE